MWWSWKKCGIMTNRCYQVMHDIFKWLNCYAWNSQTSILVSQMHGDVGRVDLMLIVYEQ